MNSKHELPVEEPTSIWHKSVTVNVKELFKALGKVSVGLKTGRLDNVFRDGFDLLNAFNLKEDSPSQLAWQLIHRALLRALCELVQDNFDLLQTNPENVERLGEEIATSLQDTEIRLGSDFFERPDKLGAFPEITSAFVDWLKVYNASEAEAKAIANRLSSYFVFALNQEWREDAQAYEPLKEALNTPFTKASKREQGWFFYRAWLQKQVDEQMFYEAFSLQRVYIPPRAYYERKVRGEADDPRRGYSGRDGQKTKRVVVKLEETLDAWLKRADKDDAIRVISGGPGSGKSSFTKMFAAKHAAQGGISLLYVPLHHFELADDLVDAIGEFVRYDSYLTENPLDPEHGEGHLLIIFDGLDELAMQGRVASELVRQFVSEVEKKVSRFNQRATRLQVLLSGRTLVVQDQASEFRKEGQVLEILPYFVPKDERVVHEHGHTHQYVDEQGLLKEDQRQQWWQKYGKASGREYEGMPEVLAHYNLTEITSQPLLNYLVALSYTRDKLDFTKENNLNVIYYDLLEAVYERGWAKGQSHPAVEGLSFDEFVRVLEEIGLTVWHGDGRTTTVEAIQQNFQRGGFRKILEKFEKGAESGVTRLLTAFYFRQAGHDPAGERTFEFTHKSFGEYLTARRIVRGLNRIYTEIERRKVDLDSGWDEDDALKHWAELCGPTAIDKYLLTFLRNEVSQQNPDEVATWQQLLCKLISFMLRHGMPMHKLGLLSYQEMTVQACNAEEALLAALSTCALVTQKQSDISWPSNISFGAWLSRLQKHDLAAKVVESCLNHLNLSGQLLSQANLGWIDLSEADDGANLGWTDLSKADLWWANLCGADLSEANLNGADLIKADFSYTDLHGANLHGANLHGANLDYANLSGADLSEANLHGANLRKADLDYADLHGADLSEANLHGARLDFAIWTNGKRCKEGSIGECIQEDD